ELGTERLRVLAGNVLAALVHAFEHLFDLATKAARSPAQVRFEDLPDVHARRYAQRVEDDVGMRPVFEERHVLDWQDAADDALVAVTAGHLVARLKLALHGNEDLDHLEHARRQLVATLELLDAVLEATQDDTGGFVVLRLQRFDVGLALVVLDGDLPPVVAVGALPPRVA